MPGPGIPGSSMAIRVGPAIYAARSPMSTGNPVSLRQCRNNPFFNAGQALLLIMGQTMIAFFRDAVRNRFGLYMTGCKFSVGQMLRSLAQIEGDGIRREWCAKKNAWDSEPA